VSDFYAGVGISELIQQIQNSEDWFVIARVSDHLQKTTQHTQLISFVENFKPYLLDLEEHLHNELEKTHFRCEYIYEIVWHCAQNISYPSFYGIWNN
jgi:predicted nuclease of restriction endonuclease-like RecB superfamily